MRPINIELRSAFKTLTDR